jgi:hypothetical protein
LYNAEVSSISKLYLIYGPLQKELKNPGLKDNYKEKKVKSEILCTVVLTLKVSL